MHGKNRKDLAIMLISLLAILYVFAAQLGSLNPFVASWDQVDFTLAVDRFDLRAMQPHFPGYPYFILGGMITGHFVHEPQLALVLFNIIFYGSALIPIYLLSLRTVPRHEAFLVSAVTYTMGYSLVIINQPMSEGAALAAFWWYFFSLVKAGEHKPGKWTILSIFLFSILLGIRLSYIPLGVGLIYLFCRQWNRNEIRVSGLVKYVLIAGLFQFIWVGALIFSEGGFSSFLELALGFTGGHFQEWGGSAASDQLSFLDRIRIYVFTNVFWWGIFSKKTILMVLYIVIGLLFVVPKNENTISGTFTLRLGALLMAAYAVWGLFAQNIDKPRHILPVAAMIVFLLTMALLAKGLKKVSIVLLLSLLVYQAITAVNYIENQSVEVPAVYQLASFLDEKPGNFVVYTWEETRVFDFLQVDFSHKRVFTYKVFQHDMSVYRGKTVYLTGSVVDGFRSQGIELDHHLQKMNEFHSDKISDPIYHEITLYKWIP